MFNVHLTLESFDQQFIYKYPYEQCHWTKRDNLRWGEIFSGRSNSRIGENPNWYLWRKLTFATAIRWEIQTFKITK